MSYRAISGGDLTGEELRFFDGVANQSASRAKTGQPFIPLDPGHHPLVCWVWELGYREGEACR